VHHAERQLLDGVERILRAPDGRLVGWSVLALHLSRIPPPGARSHHRRIAAAVLEDAAARGGGQLFSLANGDMALLFRPADAGAGIATVLARLFQGDLPDLKQMRSLWPLPQSAAPALEYIRARVTEGDRAEPAADLQVNAATIAAMEDVVQTSALADLMHRQTAVLLRPGHKAPLLPLYREVAISTAVLEARIAAIGQATADPFLFSHLGGRLDFRMLAALRQDVPGGGLLSLGLGPAALHVNLTLPGILSASFVEFADACLPAIEAGFVIGAEIQLVEAFADAKTFVLARERLRLAGLRLILDGVNHHVLAVSSPGVLDPALVKLNWTPAIPAAGPALLDSIARLGPDRIVLHRTESEAAIAWGLAAGITRFQGRYIDAMLAAERLRHCPAAAGCAIRQCMERASATGPAARTGCGNAPLLDLAAPAYVAPACATPADTAPLALAS
jgi:hypothetical protein